MYLNVDDYGKNLNAIYKASRASLIILLSFSRIIRKTYWSLRRGVNFIYGLLLLYDTLLLIHSML